jgi:hypothetical protein
VVDAGLSNQGNSDLAMKTVSRWPRRNNIGEVMVKTKFQEELVNVNEASQTTKASALSRTTM